MRAWGSLLKEWACMHVMERLPACLPWLSALVLSACRERPLWQQLCCSKYRRTQSWVR